MNQFLNKLYSEVEQKFSGRLRLLHPTDNRDLGLVEIQQGKITNCKFIKRNGYNALLSASMAYLDAPFKIIVEPETAFGEIEIKIKTETLLTKVIKASAYYDKKRKLRPPMNLKMSVNPKFLITGDPIHNHEFDLLCAISDLGRAKEIYTQSPLFDHEITLGLIKLREKKAIKVVR